MPKIFVDVVNKIINAFKALPNKIKEIFRLRGWLLHDEGFSPPEFGNFCVGAVNNSYPHCHFFLNKEEAFLYYKKKLEKAIKNKTAYLKTGKASLNSKRNLAYVKEVYAKHFPQVSKAVEKSKEEECPHDDHDHGICLDCGEDITDRLVMQAEAYYEGDR